MMMRFFDTNFKKATTLFAGLAMLSVSLIALGFTPTAYAWSAGRIIDDAVFYNGDSMNTGEIQNFLNSKVPSCDTNGTKQYRDTGMTRAQWASANNKPAPPYVCLRNYSQITVNKSADSFCNGHSAGQKSAAQIISEVAQSCGVSPKALIVLLQKEQSLITDDWPWSVQYDKATGYGCPDTAPCDQQYYGFFNQVYNAARQFKVYRAYPHNYNHVPNANNNVRYNPNSGCGSSVVHIQNQATAGLYNYTPYQPNQALLNGSPDSCSSYGNYNFWNKFREWFGTTYADKPQSIIEWKFENLDGGGSANSINPTTDTVGVQPKTITYKGELYVFYHNASLGYLELAKASSDGWSYTTLDGHSTAGGRVQSSVGKNVAAAIHNDALHIIYFDSTNGALRHAWLPDMNGTWQFETMDGTPSAINPSTARVGMSNALISYNNSLQLFYYDATHGNLKHAWYNTWDGWRFEHLDGDWGSVARYNSSVGENPVVTLYQSSLQLFYYDPGRGNLRHAWVTPWHGWRFENLDGAGGTHGRYNSNVGQDPSVVVQGSSMQVFYYDPARGNLRHAWTAPWHGWRFENLDGDGGSISREEARIGSMSQPIVMNGKLYVFYRQNNSGLLRYAWADSGGWHFAYMEGSPNSISGYISNTGFWPTVTVYGSNLQLYYFDNNQRALRHAWGPARW